MKPESLERTLVILTYFGEFLFDLTQTRLASVQLVREILDGQHLFLQLAIELANIRSELSFNTEGHKKSTTTSQSSTNQER